jgi:signal transduction histidine kinase
MAVLMISSQLLLTSFVIYWLVGQYRAEKTQLHDQLRHEYFLVQDQLVDTMLMKHLVMPSLNDSVMIKIQRQNTRLSETLTDSATTVVRMQEIIPDLPVDEEMFAIHLDGEALSDSGTRSLDVSTVVSEEERMVRSVKLFINENPDAFQSTAGVHVFAMELDSASLLLNMEHAVEAKDWPFALEYIGEQSSEADLAGIPGIIIGGGPDSPLPFLRVYQFGAYLIRSIFPQILFGMILLILSGSALLFAYRSLRRQLALNRLRDDFIGNISHELKTPVSTVKIALEALRTYDLQKDPRLTGEYLEMAASELDRLERLVGKVLHHEMLNNSSLILEKEDCDLGDLARSVVRTLDIPIQEKGARVRISEEGEPCRVLVDRIYVEGMIMNLVDNSLKYTGDHPEIQIRIESTPSGTHLSVSDKGPGIPDEYKDQVFEKFFRIPAGNQHNVKGYGLGLNFAYQVMTQHGGSISYHNLQEGGCRFTLQFPPAQV